MNYSKAYIYNMDSEIFSKQSDYYKKYRPEYPDEMFRFLYRHLKGGDNAYDCGTGTGTIACRLAERFKMVYAVDVSAEQLRNAVQKENIEYSLGKAEEMPFPDRFFDLVTVGQALHWFDTDKFFGEVTRVLKPDGVIAIMGYGRIMAEEQIDVKIHEFYRAMFANYYTANRKLLEHEYRNIRFPFDETECPGFEIEYHWDIKDLQGYFYSWSAVQRYIDENHSDPTIAIIDSLRSLWKERRKVRFPVFIRLGRLNRS